MPESHFIPFERLPPGYLDALERRPEIPVEPQPAATLVLLREGAPGLETLLLKRSPRSLFVPGAFVFPGGRVDRSDHHPEALRRLLGVTPEGAAHRLGLDPAADPPAVAYWVAAIREAFEETGLFPYGPEDLPPSSMDPEVEDIREGLMAREIGWVRALDQLDVHMPGGALEYIGHWITPEAEPRRYDTRFFAAEVRGDALPVVDRREMVEAVWLTPEEALDRYAQGDLPLILPTLATLQELVPFRSPGEVRDHYRPQRIAARLPRPVRTAHGVEMQLP